MSDQSEEIKKIEALYHKLQELMSDFSAEDVKKFLESIDGNSGPATEQKKEVLRSFHDVSTSLNKLAEFIERHYKV